MSVKRLKRSLESSRELEGVEILGRAASFLWHVLPNVLPKIAKHGHLITGDVFRDGDAGQLHDATFDSIHEREITHRPREQGALGIAGTTQEKWSCRQIHHAGNAEFPIHCFKTGNPESGCFAIFIRFLFLLTLQFFVIFILGLLTVAVMRFVIQDQNVFQSHQIWHHPLEHLSLSFECVEVFTVLAFEQGTSSC